MTLGQGQVTSFDLIGVSKNTVLSLVLGVRTSENGFGRGRALEDRQPKPQFPGLQGVACGMLRYSGLTAHMTDSRLSR